MSDTIDWKARCEKAERERDGEREMKESQFNAAEKLRAELDRVNRAHEECLDKRCQLELALEGVTRDWQKTDRAAAEMRAVIEKLWSEGMKAFWGYSNYADLQKMVGLSISTDAGRDYHHRDELVKLANALSLAVATANAYTNGLRPTMDGSPKDIWNKTLAAARSKGLI